MRPTRHQDDPGRKRHYQGAETNDARRDTLYRKVLRGVVCERRRCNASTVKRFISVQPAGVNAALKLRVPSTDVPTYDQVFLSNEYGFRAVERPRVIVDAGANIGLASSLLRVDTPKRKSLRSSRNATTSPARHNVRPYDNIVPLQAALWCENTTINIGRSRRRRVGIHDRACRRRTRGSRRITVDRLMSDYDIDRIDILKVDIEGAEKEVFADTSAWIDRVGSIIVGCTSA